MDTDSVIQETRRVLEICNACRYCDGFCATFQAMELRRVFLDGELAYLANLCHGCRACYYACQYAPPHPFSVNAPRSFATLRYESYQASAWPRPLAVLFQRNGVAVGLVTAASIAVVAILTMLTQPAGALHPAHSGSGAFYAVIPWVVLVLSAGSASLFSVLALVMGGVRFWRAAGSDTIGSARSIGAALRDILSLRYLGGAGYGCNDRDERFTQTRRYFHHAMLYGFLLCFAATCIAAVYADVLGYDAPYAFFSPPVLLGTIGGVLLMVGAGGLFWLRRVADPAPDAVNLSGSAIALVVLLLLVAASGLLLLACRATGAMVWLLPIHFGMVLAVIILLPYSKFVHALYRALALVRWAQERKPSVARPSWQDRVSPSADR